MNRHFRYLTIAAAGAVTGSFLPVAAAAAPPPPAAGQAVSDVPGVVTNVTSSGFYLQDPSWVGGTPFKQAIDVYTGSKPTVVAGDDVTVSGTVTEYYPDESDTPSSLPVAELEDVTV